MKDCSCYRCLVYDKSSDAIKLGFLHILRMLLMIVLSIFIFFRFVSINEIRANQFISKYSWIMIFPTLMQKSRVVLVCFSCGSGQDRLG